MIGELLAQRGNPGAALAGMACGLVIGLTIGVLIGAVILRAAISLANKFSEDPIPEPEFGQACLIQVVRILVNFAFGFGLGLLAAIAAGGQLSREGQMVLQIVAGVLGIPVSAVVLLNMLPTSFGKALLVAFIELLIALGIGLVIGLMVFGIFMATGAR